MVAPATTAPVASVTPPEIVPVMVCAVLRLRPINKSETARLILQNDRMSCPLGYVQRVSLLQRVWVDVDWRNKFSSDCWKVNRQLQGNAMTRSHWDQHQMRVSRNYAL